MVDKHPQGPPPPVTDGHAVPALWSTDATIHLTRPPAIGHEAHHHDRETATSAHERPLAPGTATDQRRRAPTSVHVLPAPPLADGDGGPPGPLTISHGGPPPRLTSTHERPWKPTPTIDEWPRGPSTTADGRRRTPTNIHGAHHQDKPVATAAHSHGRRIAMAARSHDRRTATGANHHLRHAATGVSVWDSVSEKGNAGWTGRCGEHQLLISKGSLEGRGGVPTLPLPSHFYITFPYNCFS
ncbi:hypothetical protein K443DRAFT_12491 [Laccaria amethystina LaAM-08-1]|uniref:Uncharacterized protein n=1 Tax=Laccaria amethystina LaAM-08-1 TaxID=1095629 RepID=A0A0C9WJ30_9AGAR|nr:hypothetical protein K443DRAFT_12491 [Laccaria amethystina LaAM-08-1]